jgi:citronellol/citronellal dehydrogenase
LVRPSRDCSGNFFTDEEVLRQDGVTDFSAYSLGAPEDRLVPDIFL